MVATRVIPSEIKTRAQAPQAHLDELPVRDRERESEPVMTLSKAALPSHELTAFERRQRADSQEFTFAPVQPKPAMQGNTLRAKAPVPQPVAASPSPGRAGLVRKGGGETEKKSKWMDLPAIWRRARNGDKGDGKAAQG